MQSIQQKEAKKFEITFYDKLCWETMDCMSYETFKNYAIERMKILRKLENNIKDISGMEDMTHDMISHFCLRLIAAQTDWSMEWLVKYEGRLMEERLKTLSSDDFEYLYKNVLLQHFVNLFETSNKIEKENKRLKLSEDDRIGKYGYYDPDVICGSENYNFIHFTKVHDKMGSQHFSMTNGYTQTTIHNKKSHFVNEFKAWLMKQLQGLNAATLVDSEKLSKLHFEIFMRYTAVTTSEENSIDNITREDMPLCMKLLFNKLDQNQHLKFNDRNQLILFLKDLKIPVHETLNFTRSKLPAMKEKELTYTVRHNYGMEGKRANYSCFSCQKIAGLSNDPNSTGCPFRNNKTFAKQFVDIEDNDEYLVSCKKHMLTMLENTHLEPTEITTRTPAEFYHALQKLKDIEKANAENNKE